MLKHKAFETVAESCLDHLSEKTSHVEPNPMDRGFFFLLHNHLVPKSSLCLGQIESSLWLSSTSNIPERAKSFICSLRMIEIQSKRNKQTKQTNKHTHKQKHKTTKQTNEISYHGNLVWCRGCAIQCKARPSPRPIS